MSRKIIIKKHLVKKDFKYNKLIISLLINKILNKGKKNIAENILYNSFKLIELKTKRNPILITEKAIKNISPRVRLESVYINNNKFQVPKTLNLYYSTKLAIKWLVNSSKKRFGKSMDIKLSNEILDSFNNIGNSIKKKNEMHKKAELNKAYIKLNN